MAKLKFRLKHRGKTEEEEGRKFLRSTQSPLADTIKIRSSDSLSEVIVGLLAEVRT